MSNLFRKANAMTNSETDNHYRRTKEQFERVQNDMLFNQLIRDYSQGELSDEEIEQRLENCGRTRADLSAALKPKPTRTAAKPVRLATRK